MNLRIGLFRWPIMAGLMVLTATTGSAQPPGANRSGAASDPASATTEPSTANAPWARMPIARGSPVSTRPFPPRTGRNRCINVNSVAGAQLFGDFAIELTMRNGQRYRMFFARECPALSFYQGFYYRRQRTGQLCAGRDVVGSRAGGECAIASILPVRRIGS